MRFPGSVDFQSSEGGREIYYYPKDGVDIVVVNHLLLNQVIPRLLSQQGEIMLHGSAVVNEEQAIVFLGESGMGKSTISASFCQQGFSLLTDDCLLLKKVGDEYWGYPSYPGLRLWPASREALSWENEEYTQVAQHKTKERISLDCDNLSFNSEPVRVKHIYILDCPSEEDQKSTIQISPVGPRQAFIELRKSSFDLDTSDRSGNRRTFKLFSEAVNALGVYRLSYPREMSLLPQVRETVLEHISGR